MPTFAEHPYAAFLPLVTKPARYTGGEAGQVVKDWSAVEARICLAFPDVYDIGMSHLGYKILYKILNDDPRTLAERCYCPWVDMERELRARAVPLVSLESARPLRDFDVVGLSLQYELTYSNCLTMLDLGGVPIRSCDRGEDAPLVLAGGPTATHPEPVAPFFDAIVVGDGEEAFTAVALAWVRAKARGLSRAERLRELASLTGVYVPSLYTTSVDADSGLHVVERPADPALPFPVRRAFVADLAKFPFPDDGPIGGPEAIFDRMSIEIARGCTEGCRFCQAGMIYRPVRERDPQEIVDTIVRSVKKSGFDEASLSCLSTADYSCIGPLVKKVVAELAPERVSLGVASLRAYGLSEDVLDDLGQVRATGLTFAPEAGTQRMRDVINKNVTEEQLLETAERVFSRAWSKVKLYFMIGLPTETDEDVIGIIETAARTLAVGRRLRKGRADVTVSVSTHVPKPHTPFQWCAMDRTDDVLRKQALLREAVRPTKLELRTHRCDESVLEGIFARGDRRLADVLEAAWRAGARFDSWEDQLRLDVWREAFEAHGVEASWFLDTLPLTARLPWDHIDVGLAEGFLAKEYKKALKSRLSPPCGKTVGSFVHAATLEDHEADARPLVCYDCGVACDLTQMRDERAHFLTKMGALRRLPLAPPAAEAEPAAPEPKRRRPPVRPDQGPTFRVRLRFRKTGPASMLGHLDLVRALPRVLRRAGLSMAYSLGFHPKPDMTFGPALSLGVASLAEHVDVKLLAPLDEGALERMNAGAPSGLVFEEARMLGAEDASLMKVVTSARYLLAVPRSALAPLGGDAWLAARIAWVMAQPEISVRRQIDQLAKQIDVRSYVVSMSLADDAAAARALALVGLLGDLAVVEVAVRVPGSGGVKAQEVIEVLAGGADMPAYAIRSALLGERDGEPVSPLDLERLRKPRSPAPEAVVEVVAEV